MQAADILAIVFQSVQPTWLPFPPKAQLLRRQQYIFKRWVGAIGGGTEVITAQCQALEQCCFLISAAAEAVPPAFHSPVPLSCISSPLRSPVQNTLAPRREDLRQNLFSVLLLWAHQATIRSSCRPLPRVFSHGDMLLQVVTQPASPSQLLRLKFAGTYRSHEEAQLARAVIRLRRADKAGGCCSLPALISRPMGVQGLASHQLVVLLQGQGCLQRSLHHPPQRRDHSQVYECPLGGLNHSLPLGAEERCSVLAGRMLCPRVRSCLQKQLPKTLSQTTCLPPCSVPMSPRLSRAWGDTGPPSAAQCGCVGLHNPNGQEQRQSGYLSSPEVPEWVPEWVPSSPAPAA